MNYKENHYVPCWYQERFLPTTGERKFRYLDLTPEQFRDPKGIVRTKTALHRWGAVSCFKETDLYTVKFGRFESTEIEQYFFGKVDTEGREAVEFFANYRDFADFRGEKSPEKVFNALLNYMSIQKFRTPKGLKYLSTLIDVTNKNSLLLEMQRLQNWHCAIWTESIWALVDANNTETKLIISDHPVTVYNREIFPEGQYARKFTDPDFRMSGTQTLFPLSPTRLLVMTNLSWARNPYGNALEERPNPKIFRQAMFKFTAIQMGRELDETEVNQINYIIKRRAARYVAAAKEEWLYPEQKILTTHWRKLDDRYLLMPDPRSLHLGGEIIIGYGDGRATSFDEYGRRPWEKDYQRKVDQIESRTLRAFQGEYARLFGSKRRGITEEFGGRMKDVDSSDFHQYHLDLEEKYRPAGIRPRRDARSQ